MSEDYSAEIAKLRAKEDEQGGTLSEYDGNRLAVLVRRQRESPYKNTGLLGRSAGDACPVCETGRLIHLPERDGYFCSWSACLHWETPIGYTEKPELVTIQPMLL